MLSTHYEDGGGKFNPQMTWDTWRLNVDGSMSGIDLSFEYRFYPTSDTHFLHHGYLGYAFSDNVYMKLGVSQVPFGMPGFASHSWFFKCLTTWGWRMITIWDQFRHKACSST